VIGHKAALALLLGALSLGGCASVSPNLEPPRLSLAGLELVDATLFEQRFLLKLRVQNPNEFSLPIKGLDYELELNGQAFARGLSNKAVTVPRLGSEVIEVEAISNLAGIVNQVRQVSRGDDYTFGYRIKGKAYLTQLGREIPFDEDGEGDLREVFPQ